MKIINKKIFFIIATLLLIYYPTIAVQIKYASDVDVYHQHERSLFPYHQLQDDSLFRDDYLTDYINAYPKAQAFYLMNKVWAKYFDLRILHKFFPMVLWIVFIACMGIAAWKLGGQYAAWATIALALNNNIFLEHIFSAIPHTTAFPLLGAALVALLYARVYMLAGITILSGLFYPPVTPVIGLSMAYLLLITKREHRGQAKEWLLWKRMTLLAVTAITVCVFILPALETLDGYGKFLGATANVEEFPEAGKLAGYSLGNHMPFIYVLYELMGQFFAIDCVGFLIVSFCLIGLFIVSGKGWLQFNGNMIAKARMNAFLWASLMAFFSSCVFLGYELHKFLIYPLPTIITLLFPIGLITLVQNNPDIKRDHLLVSVLLILFITMQMNAKNPAETGYMLEVDDNDKKVFDFISSKPKDAMFVGWPGPSETIDWVPYISKRKALLIRKLHYPTYYDYTMEMRKRMYAIVDAYLGVDIKPIHYLRDTWGVDYLIIDTRHFTEKPEYFAPFNKKIDELWEKNKDSTFELQKHLDNAVFHSGSIYILDLSTL